MKSPLYPALTVVARLLFSPPPEDTEEDIDPKSSGHHGENEDNRSDTRRPHNGWYQ